MSESAEPQASPPYIVCIDLHEQLVCVVGGGQIALRKVESLLAAGARVHIISPAICPGLQDLLGDPDAGKRLHWCQGPYQRNLPTGSRLVIACTDKRQVNRQVRQDCRICNVLCNVVDDPELCDFILPSVRKMGRVQIAISTGGSSPSLARTLADTLAGAVPAGVSLLAHLLAKTRLEVREQIPDTGERKDLYEVLCSEESLKVLQESGQDGWWQWYQKHLTEYQA